MMILDRSLDLITPFCVQQTFVGALDEAFALKLNRLDFTTKTKVTDTARLGPPEDSKRSGPIETDRGD